MLRLERLAIHEAPATTLASSATSTLCARPNRPVAAAVPSAPPTASRSGPSRRFSQGRARAPPTAEAPMTPSRTP